MLNTLHFSHSSSDKDNKMALTLRSITSMSAPFFETTHGTAMYVCTSGTDISDMAVDDCFSTSYQGKTSQNRKYGKPGLY